MQNHNRKFNKNQELHMIKLPDAIPVICLEKAKNTEKQVFLAFIDTIMILFLIFASQPNPNASRSTSLSQVF